jgi:rSAM/selenodomain-associated transferase 2
MKISVIIPTFNEELAVAQILESVSRLINVDEVIVVDGGSTDSTVRLIERYDIGKPLKLIKLGEANRGKQLDEGTRHASHEIFWFLHADTSPVQGSARQIKKLMRYDEIVGGNFEIIFEGQSRWVRFLRWVYPYLKNIGLIYGDSAVFVRREVYEKVGGMKHLPLFEDLDLIKRLQKRGRFVRINLPVTTSLRQFDKRSFVLTFAEWAFFQGLYWCGVPAQILAKMFDTCHSKL